MQQDIIAENKKEELVTHKGGCHCKSVRWEVDAPKKVLAWKCNCTVCYMRQNHHFIVPKSQFRLLQGEDSLTLYTFGTGAAKHLFCKTCGVLSFYQPRSNPDGYAVTVYCVDPGTIEEVKYIDYDGQNWEKAYDATGIEKVTKNE